MDPARILEVDATVDLKVFSAYLWQQGIPHRVYEERGKQVLEVAHAYHGGRVREDFEAWRSGTLTLHTAPGQRQDTAWTAAGFDLSAIKRLLRQYPVLAAMLALAVLAFPITSSLERGELNPVLNAMTIIDIAQRPVTNLSSLALLLGALGSGEVWRLLTPAFLHFGVAHLGFNMVAVSIFGRPIEKVAGSAALLAIALVIAVLSNVAQFLVSGNPMFGGLSGVAYGLFGFVATRSRQAPEHPDWKLPPAFTVMIVAFLILMSTGVTQAFGVHIANTAHWTGLGIGVALALVWPLRPGRVVSPLFTGH